MPDVVGAYTAAISICGHSSSHGQGRDTAFAQIASSSLGIAFEDVRIVHSDTSLVARGEGTWGSRSLQIGG